MSLVGVQSASSTERHPLAATSGVYGVLCPLASGGMGEVFVAVRREGAFERLFALKRLKRHLQEEPEVRAMFLDEARLAGLVRHPNVVAVVDVGEDAAGPFSVMEYVEGVSAMDLVRLASASSGAVREQLLPLGLCLRVARDVALGLHAAHELTDPAGRPLNLVHRDVSPQNILVGFDGVAKVTDFGIAKALGRTARTSTGILKGKLGYLSPEQLRFEEPDRRADLFALGVVLFELLAGTRLYDSRGEADGPRRILTEPPPDPSDYRDDAPPELVELLFRLLAKDREQRPATAKDVARMLDGLIAEVAQSADDLDTGDFLAGRFAAARTALQSRIAEARAAAGPARARGPSPSGGAASPRRGRVAAVATGVAVVAAVAGVWFARTQLEPVPAVSTLRTATETAAPRAEPMAPAPPPTVASSAPAPGAPRKETPAKGGKPRVPRGKSPLPLWEEY